MGEEGFSSDSSLLYHRYLPTAIVKSEEVDGAADGATTAQPAAAPPSLPHRRAARGR